MSCATWETPAKKHNYQEKKHYIRQYIPNTLQVQLECNKSICTTQNKYCEAKILDWLQDGKGQMDDE